MRARLLLVPVATVAVVAGITLPGVGTGASVQESAAQPVETVMLNVGDTVQVQGAPLECQATRRHGRVSLECRRTGRRKGTYGTFLDARTAIVARFRSATTAQTVFTARHHGDWTACTTGARARAARDHCR